MNYLITCPMFAGKSKYLIKSLDYLLMEKSDIKILFIPLCLSEDIFVEIKLLF